MIVSIRVPADLIDERAELLGKEASLSNLGTKLQVKVPYKRKYRKLFNMFDERERVETIVNILEQEIDFRNLMLSGVILQHGPMMKRKVW